MIVSRKEAEAACQTLGLSLDTLTPEAVASAYREAAKAAHPDGGGTMERFVAVDRSKHVLLEWLKRAVPAAPPADHGERCPRCDGRGYIDSQRGFRSMRVSCPLCRGTGELGVEQEKEY